MIICLDGAATKAVKPLLVIAKLLRKYGLEIKLKILSRYHDTIVVELAEKLGCVLVTSDHLLYGKATRRGIPTIFIPQRYAERRHRLKLAIRILKEIKRRGFMC